MPFPFLRLPLLAQLLIIQSLNTLDLLTFSLLSCKTAKLAKSVKRKAGKLVWDLCNNQNVLKLIVSDLNFHDILTLQVPLPPGATLSSFNGFPVNHQGDQWFLGNRRSSLKDRLEVLAQISNHLLDILKFKNLEVKGAVSRHLVPVLLKQVLFPKPLNSVYLYTVQDVLSQEDLHYILGGGLIAERLQLDCNVRESVKYFGSLKTNYLYLENASFLSLEALLTMECKTVELHQHGFSSADFNRLVNTWLEGSLPNLQSITVFETEDINFDEVLEDIPIIPWTVENRENFRQRFGELTIREERCIRRENDGRMATVAESEILGWMLLVWEM